ncbi:DUF1819 domain-containing protein [Enhygromyxa salina]|uniref:DUF1819 domain-containing protein n=1 Tax=Enhygromyxa salina TaxID=215803 RepID=A0A2S9YJB3_9BACT|nr:DUF1819 domain-containing protein [Enhygromyxa salina]PRQ05132.1 hypothetical protein ENSA7_47610 [Enhygromyxa salina]
MPDRVPEAKEPHTQLLRVTLEVENSRGYWQRVTSPDSMTMDDEAERAFVEFWFGTKSMPRVRDLINAFRARFAAFPGALDALHAWADVDRVTRIAICHWHLQLCDPIYRRFTGEFLPERRASGRDTITRPLVLRWMNDLDVDARWSPATRAGFASKLLSAAHAAGLVATTRDPRALMLPRVPPAALGYLMYLLRGVEFEGSLHQNPYLRSVGLEGSVVDDKLRAVVGVSCRRVGDITDFSWDYESLTDWVRHTRAAA